MKKYFILIKKKKKMNAFINFIKSIFIDINTNDS